MKLDFAGGTISDHITRMAEVNPMMVFDRGLVRQHRRRAARNFMRYRFLFDDVADRLRERLADIKRPFTRVLELNAHDGAFAAALKQENSARLTVAMEGVHDYFSSPGVSAVVGDEEFLPFAPESFDLIVSNLGLHWVNDLPGALVQMRKVLRPDGLLLAAMFGGETLHELRACLYDAEIAVTGGVSPRLSPFADLRDAAGLLQRAGYALPVTDSDTIMVGYDDAFALMRDLRAMGEGNANLGRLRRPTRRAVMIEAARLYAERFAEPGGRIRATFQVIYLHGWAPHVSQQKALRPGEAQQKLAEALGTTEYSAGDKATP